MLFCVLCVLELQLQQAVDVQGHGVIVGVLGCCFVVRWVCYVGARGMCGGRCGAVRGGPGKRAVWRGCVVRLLVGGCPGRLCRPWARFRLWPVVGVELACDVRGFEGWCRLGGSRGAEPAWRGVVPVFVRCGVSSLRVGEAGTVSRSCGVDPWMVARGWSSGGVCGIGVSQPGGCGRVVLGGVG